MSYIFPQPALVSLFVARFLVQHVKGQIRLLILITPCWMETSCPQTIFDMLEDVPHGCSIIENPIKDVMRGLVLKGLPSLHLTLFAAV